MNATQIKPGDDIYVRRLPDALGVVATLGEVYHVLSVKHDPVNGICDEEGCDGFTFEIRTMTGAPDHLHAHGPEIEIVTKLVAKARQVYQRDPEQGDERTLERLIRDLTIAGFAAGRRTWWLDAVLHEVERQLYDVRNHEWLDE